MAPPKGKEKASQAITPIPKSKEGNKESKEMSWAEVSPYTDNNNNPIGSGSTCKVYGGEVKGKITAIKVLEDVTNYRSQWKNERDFLKEHEHQNIINLIGYGEERELKKLFLVLDYVPRTLEDKLIGTTWEQIMKILKGIAEGIAYLHHENWIHTDIKPGNVFLDEGYNVKLGDFGGVVQEGKMIKMSTPDYEPPETRVPHPRELNAFKSFDIYSYGVTMLQLIMQLKDLSNIPLDKKKEKLGIKNIVGLFEYLKNSNESVVDETLNCTEEQKKQIIDLATECTSKHPKNRPNIDIVRQKLQHLK